MHKVTDGERDRPSADQTDNRRVVVPNVFNAHLPEKDDHIPHKPVLRPQRSKPLTKHEYHQIPRTNTTNTTRIAQDPQNPRPMPVISLNVIGLPPQHDLQGARTKHATSSPTPEYNDDNAPRIRTSRTRPASPRAAVSPTPQTDVHALMNQRVLLPNNIDVQRDRQTQIYGSIQAPDRSLSSSIASQIYDNGPLSSRDILLSLSSRISRQLPSSSQVPGRDTSMADEMAYAGRVLPRQGSSRADMPLLRPPSQLTRPQVQATSSAATDSSRNRGLDMTSDFVIHHTSDVSDFGSHGSDFGTGMGAAAEPWRVQWEDGVWRGGTNRLNPENPNGIPNSGQMYGFDRELSGSMFGHLNDSYNNDDSYSNMLYDESNGPEKAMHSGKNPLGDPASGNFPEENAPGWRELMAERRAAILKKSLGLSDEEELQRQRRELEEETKSGKRRGKWGFLSQGSEKLDWKEIRSKHDIDGEGEGELSEGVRLVLDALGVAVNGGHSSKQDIGNGNPNGNPRVDGSVAGNNGNSPKGDDTGSGAHEEEDILVKTGIAAELGLDKIDFRGSERHAAASPADKTAKDVTDIVNIGISVADPGSKEVVNGNYRLNTANIRKRANALRNQQKTPENSEKSIPDAHSPTQQPTEEPRDPVLSAIDARREALRTSATHFSVFNNNQEVDETQHEQTSHNNVESFASDSFDDAHRRVHFQPTVAATYTYSPWSTADIDSTAQLNMSTDGSTSMTEENSIDFDHSLTEGISPRNTNTSQITTPRNNLTTIKSPTPTSPHTQQPEDDVTGDLTAEERRVRASAAAAAALLREREDEEALRARLVSAAAVARGAKSVALLRRVTAGKTANSGIGKIGVGVRGEKKPGDTQNEEGDRGNGKISFSAIEFPIPDRPNPLPPSRTPQSDLLSRKSHMTATRPTSSDPIISSRPEKRNIPGNTQNSRPTLIPSQNLGQITPIQRLESGNLPNSSRNLSSPLSLPRAPTGSKVLQNRKKTPQTVSNSKTVDDENGLVVRSRKMRSGSQNPARESEMLKPSAISPQEVAVGQHRDGKKLRASGWQDKIESHPGAEGFTTISGAGETKVVSTAPTEVTDKLTTSFMTASDTTEDTTEPETSSRDLSTFVLEKTLSTTNETSQSTSSLSPPASPTTTSSPTPLAAKHGLLCAVPSPYERVTTTTLTNQMLTSPKLSPSVAAATTPPHTPLSPQMTAILTTQSTTELTENAGLNDISIVERMPSNDVLASVSIAQPTDVNTDSTNESVKAEELDSGKLQASESIPVTLPAANVARLRYADALLTRLKQQTEPRADDQGDGHDNTKPTKGKSSVLAPSRPNFVKQNIMNAAAMYKDKKLLGKDDSGKPDQSRKSTPITRVREHNSGTNPTERSRNSSEKPPSDDTITEKQCPTPIQQSSSSTHLLPNPHNAFPTMNFDDVSMNASAAATHAKPTSFLTNPGKIGAAEAKSRKNQFSSSSRGISGFPISTVASTSKDLTIKPLNLDTISNTNGITKTTYSSSASDGPTAYPSVSPSSPSVASLASLAKLQVELAILHHTKSQLSYYGWRPWRVFMEKQRVLHKRAEEFRKNCVFRNFFRAWRERTESYRVETADLEAKYAIIADTFRRKHQLRRGARVLHWNVTHRRNCEDQVKRLRNRLDMAMIFASWINLTAEKQEKRCEQVLSLIPTAERQGDRCIQRHAFFLLRRRCEEHRDARQRAIQAVKETEEREKRKADAFNEVLGWLKDSKLGKPSNLGSPLNVSQSNSSLTHDAVSELTNNRNIDDNYAEIDHNRQKGAVPLQLARPILPPPPSVYAKQLDMPYSLVYSLPTNTEARVLDAQSAFPSQNVNIPYTSNASRHSTLQNPANVIPSGPGASLLIPPPRLQVVSVDYSDIIANTVAKATQQEDDIGKNTKSRFPMEEIPDFSPGKDGLGEGRSPSMISRHRGHRLDDVNFDKPKQGLPGESHNSKIRITEDVRGAGPPRTETGISRQLSHEFNDVRDKMKGDSRVNFK